jgi:hypothetical protein
MLSNIVANMLALITERAKVDGHIEGVVPHLVDGGLSILQYTDDIILFMEHDLDKAKNLKSILSTFEKLSVLKLTSIKLICSILAKLTMRTLTMLRSLAMGLVSFP